MVPRTEKERPDFWRAESNNKVMRKTKVGDFGEEKAAFTRLKFHRG